MTLLLVVGGMLAFVLYMCTPEKGEPASLSRTSGATGAIAGMVSLLTTMFKSDSSTAILGIFFLPGAAVFLGMVGLATGWIAERVMEHADKSVVIARFVQYGILASAVPLGIWLGW